MPTELVVLDLDGTIIDHLGSTARALETWLPTLGRTAHAGLHALWIAAEQRHYPAWRAGEIGFAEQRRRRLRDFLPLLDLPVGDDAELDQIFTGYYRAYQASWRAFPDVAAALADLARLNVRIAVLTNGTQKQQTDKLTAVDLLERVGPVFSAQGLGVAKPGRESYLKVCAAMQVPPADTLHVGDLYDLDVLAPRAAGLNAVHLDRLGTGPLDEPQRITGLDELPDLVARLRIDLSTGPEPSR